jgi:hypothetical protein
MRMFGVRADTAIKKQAVIVSAPYTTPPFTIIRNIGVLGKYVNDTLFPISPSIVLLCV